MRNSVVDIGEREARSLTDAGSEKGFDPSGDVAFCGGLL